MSSAYDSAYQSIIALERVCKGKDSRLEQLASAALVSTEFKGIHLEAAIVKLHVLLERTAELGAAKLLGKEAIDIAEIRKPAINALLAVAAYMRSTIPSMHARIEKRYGLLNSETLKP